MKWIVFIVWLALASASSARQGLLQTLDGKNYEGDIQLTNGAFHLVRSEPPVNIPLTNLLDLKFEAPAPVPEIVMLPFAVRLAPLPIVNVPLVTLVKPVTLP